MPHSRIQAMVEYSDTEMKRVNQWFPELFRDRQMIRGELNFAAKYELTGTKKHKRWSIVSCSSDFFCLQDVYEIEIRLKELSQGRPKVFETGGRIHSVAKELGKSIGDLHINPKDGSCCLGLFLPNKDESLSQFVRTKVYPYFVWQAYYDNYKRIPPCGEFSHGETGLLEFKKQVNARGRNQRCPCGSGKKYKTCCYHRVRRNGFAS